MIARIIRILLVFAAIMLLGLHLPSLYKKVFEERSPKKLLYFSEVKSDFVFSTEVYDSTTHTMNMVYTDRQGNQLSETEYVTSLPFDNVTRLKMLGMMPDSVCGAPLTQKILKTTRRGMLIGDRDFNYQINPLFESKLNRPGVELPPDLMRINDRGVEFVDVQSNKIDQDKSRLFTDAMCVEEFMFPSTDIYGIPSTIKSRDDGYFVVDSRGKLFHLMMVKGQPYCRAINNDFEIKNIKCHVPGDLFCHIFTPENEIYILKANYTLKKLPIEHTNGRFMTTSNCYYKSYKNLDTEVNTTFVMDSLYNAVDRCTIPINSYAGSEAAQMSKRIFPFSMMITPGFVHIIPIPNPVSGFMWTNIGFLLLFIMIKAYRKRNMLNPFNIVDYIMVGVFGVYGFIAVLLFPNRK